MQNSSLKDDTRTKVRIRSRQTKGKCTFYCEIYLMYNSASRVVSANILQTKQRAYSLSHNSLIML